MGKRNLHMIEELLERYFEGETSAAEEKQIRAFFASGECRSIWLPMLLCSLISTKK